VPHFSPPLLEVGQLHTATNSIALLRDPAYDKPMAKAKKFELESPTPLIDEEALAAIDVGIRDAKDGRTVPSRRSSHAVAQLDYRLFYTQRALNDLAYAVTQLLSQPPLRLQRAGGLCLLLPGAS